MFVHAWHCQESDKFVGIDMDVKEILLNGYQIKSAKEFCNQGLRARRPW